MRYRAVLFDFSDTIWGAKDQAFGDFVPDMIHSLYTCGYRLGIISNADRYGDARWLRHTLACHCISHYFEVIISSSALISEPIDPFSSAGCHKPDVAVFQRAFDFMKIDYELGVFVGDSFRCDILGAEQLGISTIHVGEYDDPWEAELWELLEDQPSTNRHNILTSYKVNPKYITTDDLYTVSTRLRHLTEPLETDQEIILGVDVYVVLGWNLPHDKNDIIHGSSTTVIHIEARRIHNCV